jgi:large-conductance mechanosensitive channel
MTLVERFRGIDWMGVVFYPLSVILMESFWVAPWLSWIGGLKFVSEARPVLHLPSVIIIVVLSLLVTRICTRQNMRLSIMRFIVIGSGLVTMLLVLGVEYADGYTFLSGAWFAHIFKMLGDTFTSFSTVSLAIPVIVNLWWRGIMLGQSTSYFKDIYRSFILGMVALVVLIIFWQISAVSSDNRGLGSEIGIDIIAFFFFGLLSIAICHLYNMRSTMPREEARLTSVWRWLPVMLGVIGGMIIVGFVVASAISPEFIEAIGSGTRVVLGGLGQLMAWIVTPIVYIIQGLVIAFRWFVGLFSGEGQAEMNMGDILPEEFREEREFEFPPIVAEVLKWVVLGIIVGLVVFFLVKAISRYRLRRARESIDEVHESLGGWNAFKDDLALFFKSLGNKFKRRPRVTPPVFDADPKGPLDIREIFRHIQWEAAQSGVPRRRHETATEFSRSIERFVPDSRLPLKDLTKMYENVRYGEETAPKDKLDKANNLWQNLKGLIRKLRGD